MAPILKLTFTLIEYNFFFPAQYPLRLVCKFFTAPRIILRVSNVQGLEYNSSCNPDENDYALIIVAALIFTICIHYNCSYLHNKIYYAIGEA